MTRLELLQLLVARARAHGFEFRRWYTTHLGLPWINAEAAVCLLEQQRRYYALVFSHEFASTFWKPGEDLTFEVPAQSFERVMPDGTTRTIQRKTFIRRSARPEAWRYHLREMALAEEPLRYLRKYLHIEEQLDPESPPEPVARTEASDDPGLAEAKRRKKPAADPKPPIKRRPRALPTGPPAFLARPYPPPPSDLRQVVKENTLAQQPTPKFLSS